VDATDISTVLAAVGGLLSFVGTVVTGAGLWLGWRRLLERRTDEQRRVVSGSAELTAMFTGEGTGYAFATPMPPAEPVDAPITKEQLTAVVVSIHKEMQKLRGDLHGVRTDVAGLPIVEGTEVDARARQILAEHEHREGSTAFADLSWALIGVGISALGSVVGVLGLFVGWYGGL
jgi:hypothetical protein